MGIVDFTRNQKGASAIEFAIVLPLFITLTFGIIEFGIIMYNQVMITNASREGARFGILYAEPIATDAQITSRVNTLLDNGNRLFNLGGDKNYNVPSPVRSDPFLSVTVSYNYDFLIVPNFIPLLPKSRTFSATTTMRME